MAKHFPDHLLRPKILTADASKFETQAKAAFETSLMSIDAEMRACASMLRQRVGQRLVGARACGAGRGPSV